MLFRLRKSRDGKGFDQQAFLVDPWERNLLNVGVIRRETSRDLDDSCIGLWISGALPAFAQDAREIPLPPDQPALDGRTQQSYVYYRRAIDIARAERWSSGPEFQVVDLHKDV